MRGDKSKSTIIATGTGSGKTECFLYPLLDHCKRNPEPGIKAIVIYPMNALAGDQAKRFASVIHNTPELNGKIRVGLFIGGADITDQKTMEPEQVISCKNTLRKSPPDILLTNYKMLDYLLMRPKDQPLWDLNREDALRYLVVDESAWDTVVALAEPDVKDFLVALSATGAKIPEVCYELEGDKGMVLAEAELAWPDPKVALLLEYQIEESGPVFKDQGWEIITTDTDINTILNLLGDN